jgi:hypothetical protein
MLLHACRAPGPQSFKANIKRFRNAALRGISKDIHADIQGDQKLEEVRRARMGSRAVQGGTLQDSWRRLRFLLTSRAVLRPPPPRPDHRHTHACLTQTCSTQMHAAAE